MEEPLKWTLPFGFIFVAFILVIAAIFTPWWTVKTTTGAQVVVNASAKIDYTILQKVVASKSTDKKPITGSFSDLTDNQADRDALVSLFYTTFILVIVGLALTILTIALIFIPKLRSRFFRYSTITTLVAGILLFVAVANLATTMPPQVSKLSRLAHPKFNVPSSWVSIAPSDISDFWGSQQIPSSTTFPTWSHSEDFWIWGASFGWYLTFIAALLLLMTSLIIHTMLRKRKIS